MTVAGTKGLVAMPRGIRPEQFITFGVPACSRAQSRAGDEGQRGEAAGTMRLSSGPDSNFPSRSFWSGLLGFFPGTVVAPW